MKFEIWIYKSGMGDWLIAFVNSNKDTCLIGRSKAIEPLKSLAASIITLPLIWQDEPMLLGKPERVYRAIVEVR